MWVCMHPSIHSSRCACMHACIPHTHVRADVHTLSGWEWLTCARPKLSMPCSAEEKAEREEQRSRRAQRQGESLRLPPGSVPGDAIDGLRLQGVRKHSQAVQKRCVSVTGTRQTHFRQPPRDLALRGPACVRARSFSAPPVATQSCQWSHGEPSRPCSDSLSLSRPPLPLPAPSVPLSISFQVINQLHIGHPARSLQRHG